MVHIHSMLILLDLVLMMSIRNIELNLKRDLDCYLLKENLINFELVIYNIIITLSTILSQFCWLSHRFLFPNTQNEMKDKYKISFLPLSIEYLCQYPKTIQSLCQIQLRGIDK